MSEQELIIRRVWRSQLGTIAIYILLCVACISLSRTFPASVVDGLLFKISGLEVYLTLPLFSLLPLAALVTLCLPIYDGYMHVDSRGIELVLGILSLKQKITRVRFEDIRSIEIGQSILERLLDYGTIGVSSAATESIELSFNGVGSPREIQDFLQSERDRRLRVAPKDVITEVAVGD
jgi:hypothetical protein